MANVTIHSKIDASWPQGQSNYSPGNPEQLAIISIDLLVRELGIEAAHVFVGQQFKRYFDKQKSPISPGPANSLGTAGHSAASTPGFQQDLSNPAAP